jgi:riboflavin biosynthesis pyrimidine reductase
MLELGPVAGERSARAAGGADPASVLHHLPAERGVRSVLGEGGPTLLRALVTTPCMNHFLLTLAPMLAAGSAPAVLEGVALDPPAPLRLHDAHRTDDDLFTHYVPAP